MSLLFPDIVLFPYFLYPVNQVAISGSIFMTVAIAWERYVAVHYPIDYNQAKHELWQFLRVRVWMCMQACVQVRVRMQMHMQVHMQGHTFIFVAARTLHVTRHKCINRKLVQGPLGHVQGRAKRRGARAIYFGPLHIFCIYWRPLHLNETELSIIWC